MKKNKILFILIPLLIALTVFLLLYIYYHREDQNSLTVNDKKWIEQNSSTIFDLELISNYPVYGENGVFYEFVEDFETDTGLEFNVIPYLKTGSSQ